MHHIPVPVVFLLLGCVAVLVRGSVPLEKDRVREEVRKGIDSLSVFYEDYQAISSKLNSKDISVTCALCGIVVNEIAGFLIENRTISEIETLIKQDVCDKLGAVSEICDLLVDALPVIISSLENQWSVSVVCVDLKLCTVPFPVHTDPRDVPSYTINLDLPPINRWDVICSTPVFQSSAQFLYNFVKTVLPDGGIALESVGEVINEHYFPWEYAQEIKGCAAKLGVPFGWASLFNLGYEVSDACTSIVAQTPDGKILHARNLDFWAGMGFTDTLKDMTIQVDFQKGGKTVYTTTTFAGMVGVLSGFKANAFSATVDTRFYPGGIGELFDEILVAIQEKNASLVSFLLRDVLANENDFKSALENLSNGELIADVYYILAGTTVGEGAVISRNRTAPDDVWILDSPSRWFEVETNYDHWEPAPWFDDRIDPANEAMNAVGQANISLDNMWKVLTKKPVFNLQTTYTILSCPATGEYQTKTRYCPYPCVE